MRLVKYTHACVRLESDSGVLVIDPGSYSERAALEGADAVLVTHEHFDHVDVDAIVEAHRTRPLAVFTPASVAPMLDAIAADVTAVGPGESFVAAGFPVRTFGGTHARIHADIPQVANVAYLVDGRIYHPGDSLYVPDSTTVDTLLVPVSGPWLKAGEAVDFIRAVAPRQAIGIHEVLYNPAALGRLDELIKGLARTDYRRLPVGEGLDCP